MQWPEFAHAVRAAGAILGEDRVVVIGSQSILAWFDDPPSETTMSREVDIAALDDTEVAEPARAQARATLQS